VGDQLACYPKKAADIIKMEASCSIGSIAAGDGSNSRNACMLTKEFLQVVEECPFEFESWNFVMNVMDETEG